MEQQSVYEKHRITNCVFSFCICKKESRLQRKRIYKKSLCIYTKCMMHLFLENNLILYNYNSKTLKAALLTFQQ